VQHLHLQRIFVQGRHARLGMGEELPLHMLPLYCHSPTSGSSRICQAFSTPDKPMWPKLVAP
jgi:hypothetical protein